MSNLKLRVALLLLIWALLATVGTSAAQTCPCEAEPLPVEALSVEVLATYPHDSQSFTQGLLLHEGTFYESAGRYGESDVRQVEIETGEVLRQVELSEQFFAEGLTLVDNLIGPDGAALPPRLIQITWQENVAIVWDLATLTPVDTYLYETEGWGICYDGSRLYMSDGSSSLFVRDAATFRLLDMIAVTLEGEPVALINELECVGDVVYANLWQSDTIVRIDKASGVVTGEIDASDLLTAEQRASLEPGAVLNGIAYDPAADIFYITGKLWPVLLEVRFVAAD